MQYSEHRPSAALAPWVECYWWLRGQGNAPESVATDGRMEIILHLGDVFEELTANGWRKQSRQLVSGQITRPVIVRPAGDAYTVGVRLKSWAGGAVLREQASRLTDRLVELEAVNARLASALRPLLSRTSVMPPDVDSLVAGCLDGRSAVDRRIASTVIQAEGSAGRMAADALSRHAGVGSRQLERLFQQHVGVGPKLFSRMVRFRSVLRAVSRTSKPNWAVLAAAFGYADQAHMIRDFKQFAGCTPGRLSAAEEPLSLQFASGG